MHSFSKKFKFHLLNVWNNIHFQKFIISNEMYDDIKLFFIGIYFVINNNYCIKHETHPPSFIIMSNVNYILGPLIIEAYSIVRPLFGYNCTKWLSKTHSSSYFFINYTLDSKFINKLKSAGQSDIYTILFELKLFYFFLHAVKDPYILLKYLFTFSKYFFK